MRWLMLCRAPELYSCKRLKQACKERGISLDILDPNRFLLQLGKEGSRLFYQATANEMPSQLSEYAAILPRFGASSTQIGCYVLQQFEMQKKPVLNGATAIKLARDKWRSLQQLQMKNLPIPRSFLGGELLSTSGRFSQQNGKIVLKTLCGMQGEGVSLIEKSCCSEMPHFTGLSQDFIAESQGKDIRAFVIGNQVVAAMQRTASGDDFRANIHLGGSAQAVNLDEKSAKLAVQASQAMGLDVAGVDLIQTEQGLAVLEVNASPGLEMIEKVSQQDLAGMMVDYLRAKVR